MHVHGPSPLYSLDILLVEHEIAAVMDRVVPMEGMDPFGQPSAWSTLKGCPHEQCCGSFVGVALNLKQRESLDAHLFRL